jgi:hypothetical protein
MLLHITNIKQSSVGWIAFTFNDEAMVVVNSVSVVPITQGLQHSIEEYIKVIEEEDGPCEPLTKH